MPIRLAFSTVACPQWTLEQVAERAQQMGYQGVELRTLGPGGGAIASDPGLTDPRKVRDVFRAFGVEPVCLSTSIELQHKDLSRARQSMRAAEGAIEQAAAIGCPFVRFFGHEVRPGDSRQAVMQRIAERLRELAPKAGGLGVQVLVENAGSFSRAKDWWWIFNLVDHPMVGLLWNVANAAAAGEPSSVSVTTLNSRIRLAKLKDLQIGEGSGWVQLGEGSVGIEMFVKRLLGIGYDGYVTVEWDRAWLDSLAPADEFLPEAQKRLKGWIDAVTEASAQSEGAPAGSGTPAGQKAEAGAAHKS